MTGPERTPIFEETYRALRSGPAGRHHWTTAPEEPRVSRHGDDDADGVANQSDEDWRPDARDAHALDDEACDQAQQQPDRWVGVTRDPDEHERLMAEAVDA